MSFFRPHPRLEIRFEGCDGHLSLTCSFWSPPFHLFLSPRPLSPIPPTQRHKKQLHAACWALQQGLVSQRLDPRAECPWEQVHPAVPPLLLLACLQLFLEAEAFSCALHSPPKAILLRVNSNSLSKVLRSPNKAFNFSGGRQEGVG